MLWLIAAHGPAAAQSKDGLPCAGLEAGPAHTVTRIIDGETVALDDGRELRLIGALAPRAIDVGAAPGDWPLEVATRAELGALVLGRTIELAFDGDRVDRHGRLLAHAFWRQDGRRRWVQGHLLVHGLARAYVQAGNRSCGRELIEVEHGARQAGRGVWAEAAYRIREADRTNAILRYRNTFQVIEGRVINVGETRGVIYLNLGTGRSALSASLRRGDRRRLLGEFSDDLKMLEGRRVRVRGWIEVRRGPVINLSSAGHVEVLENPPRTPGGVEAEPRPDPRQ
jgi:endonuclease YncB( thermonuclease family)